MHRNIRFGSPFTPSGGIPVHALGPTAAALGWFPLGAPKTAIRRGLPELPRRSPVEDQASGALTGRSDRNTLPVCRIELSLWELRHA